VWAYRSRGRPATRCAGAPLRSCLAPLRPSGCLPPALAVRACIGCVPLLCPGCQCPRGCRRQGAESNRLTRGVLR
jgi:hypothetical protein